MSTLMRRESSDETKDGGAAGSLRFFRWGPSKPWPNPENSLGERIETKDGKEKVWIAKGPALQLFETEVLPQIMELLHSTMQPQGSFLLLKLYMIGTTEAKAQPMIMICCSDKRVRRKAEANLRESGILQQFPQMRWGNIESPLETHGFESHLLEATPENNTKAQKSSSPGVYRPMMPWHRFIEDFEFMNNARLEGTTLLGDTTLSGGATTLVDGSTFIGNQRGIIPEDTSEERQEYKSYSPDQTEGMFRGVGTRFDRTFSIPEEVFDNENLLTQSSDNFARKRVYSYGKRLAARLCRDLSLRTFDEEDVVRVSNSLPHILQIFTFKIAKEKDGGGYRNIIKFLLKYRRSFANQIISKARDLLKESTEECFNSVNGQTMVYKDKVEGWLPKRDAIHEPASTPPESEYGEAAPDSDDNELDSEHNFLGLVIQSRAYKWLVPRLRRELEMVCPTEPGMSTLSEAMFGELNENEILSRESAPQEIDATFHANWSPHSFFKQQEYGVPPEEAVVTALVLVGTTTKAEGLASGDYLLRQWPDSARGFMQLLQSVVKSAEGTSHDGKLADGTTLRASVQSGQFTLRASGHPDSVVEIGEQIMWISCALRSSEFTDVGTCQASFAMMWVPRGAASSVSMRIKIVVTTYLDELHGPESGACWQGLFRNPLVVKRYPTPRLRVSDSTLGLQLSLSTLMALVPNSRIVPYMGKLFIKRFSTLLVAVKWVGNVILWHVISNKDGSYVYYHDKRVNIHDIDVGSSILQEVDIAELKHVVGWTSTADNLAGTSNCNHRIRGSGLPQSLVPELELERITIGFSKVGTGNAAVKLGWRDKNISTTQEGDYRANIQFISKHFVTLYDVEDHRGFLLDGGTALLYLLRVSLISDEEDGLFDGRKINDAIQLHQHPDPRVRANNTLWRDENACLKLYYNYNESGASTDVKKVAEDSKSPVTTKEEIESRKGSWVLLSDRVTSILSMLDQAINKQGDKEFKLLLNKFPGQSRLEGYEFRKLAHNDRANVQFATPGFHSKGWLDLVHKLSAVTLFGRGFGDIIRHSDCATDTPYMCPDWRFVPKGAGYLALSNATMERVLENGDVNAWRLIDDIYMSCPQDPFRSCGHEGRRCERRHYLVKGQNKKAQRGALMLPKRGALIIGYESSMPSLRIPSPFSRGGRIDQLPLATANGNEEISVLGTSIGPLSSESSRSVDTTRPAISLATTESNHVRLAPTPDTAIELSQYSEDLSGSIEPVRSQSSKLHGTTNCGAPALVEGNSSASCRESEPSTRSQPKDSPHLHPTMGNFDSSQGTSRQRSFRGWWEKVSQGRKKTWARWTSKDGSVYK